jgi:hypothetical protein
VISDEGNKGDDSSVGIAQEGGEQVESGNEHFSPSSSGDNLGDDLDRLLNSSSAVPFCNDMTQNQEQNEDELVDYDENDDASDILRNEEEITTRAKTFADDHTEVEAHDLAVAERDDKLGEENIAQGASQEDETQDDTRQLAEMNLNNPVVKPVLTQKGLMKIIAKQPQALMQKMEWEQKKQCYKEMLSGYESPNGTSMSVGVELTALMFVPAVSESAQMISHLAQSEASDKLMKQAEQHREALEKEFKQNMERMKAELDRAIK